jgi:hypothetical protein
LFFLFVVDTTEIHPHSHFHHTSKHPARSLSKKQMDDPLVRSIVSNLHNKELADKLDFVDPIPTHDYSLCTKDRRPYPLVRADKLSKYTPASYELWPITPSFTPSSEFTSNYSPFENSSPNDYGDARASLVSFFLQYADSTGGIHMIPDTIWVIMALITSMNVYLNREKLWYVYKPTRSDYKCSYPQYVFRIKDTKVILAGAHQLLKCMTWLDAPYKETQTKLLSSGLSQFLVRSRFKQIDYEKKAKSATSVGVYVSTSSTINRVRTPDNGETYWHHLVFTPFTEFTYEKYKEIAFYLPPNELIKMHKAMTVVELNESKRHDDEEEDEDDTDTDEDTEPVVTSRKRGRPKKGQAAATKKKKAKIVPKTKRQEIVDMFDVGLGMSLIKYRYTYYLHDDKALLTEMPESCKYVSLFSPSCIPDTLFEHFRSLTNDPCLFALYYSPRKGDIVTGPRLRTVCTDTCNTYVNIRKDKKLWIQNDHNDCYEDVVMPQWVSKKGKPESPFHALESLLFFATNATEAYVNLLTIYPELTLTELQEDSEAWAEIRREYCTTANPWIRDFMLSPSKGKLVEMCRATLEREHRVIQEGDSVSAESAKPASEHVCIHLGVRSNPADYADSIAIEDIKGTRHTFSRMGAYEGWCLDTILTKAIYPAARAWSLFYPVHCRSDDEDDKSDSEVQADLDAFRAHMADSVVSSGTMSSLMTDPTILSAVRVLVPNSHSIVNELDRWIENAWIESQVMKESTNRIRFMMSCLEELDSARLLDIADSISAVHYVADNSFDIAKMLFSLIKRVAMEDIDRHTASMVAFADAGRFHKNRLIRAIASKISDTIV